MVAGDSPALHSPETRGRVARDHTTILLQANLLIRLNSAKIMVCLSLPEANRKGT